MTRRLVHRFWIMAALASSALLLPAQTPVEPDAYTVTVQFNVTGTVSRTTYRLGSKVLVDQHTPDKASPNRTLYNLQNHESLSWDPMDPSTPCVLSDFQAAAWQDPFAGGPDLTMKDARHVGRETIHGIAAVILELKSQTDSTFRLWVDPQTGLMLKAQFVSKKLGTAMTYFEVTDVSLTPPPAAIFEPPASCNSASKEAARRQP